MFGANKRDVWTIATRPYAGAHFATFPDGLVAPCILAGTSEAGVCAGCGAPWTRVVDTVYERHDKWFGGKQGARHSRGSAGTAYNEPSARSTTGWRPSCGCAAANPVPALVLDPFLGSGVTCAVAQRLGRRSVGVDLNGSYLSQAVARLSRLTLPMAIGYPAGQEIGYP